MWQTQGTEKRNTGDIAPPISLWNTKAMASAVKDFNGPPETIIFSGLILSRVFNVFADMLILR